MDSKHLIPDATSLLQDLLSSAKTLLPKTTPALLTYHLTTLPSTSFSTVAQTIQFLSVSPALWRGQASRDDHGEWEPLNFERATEVYISLKNGVLYRAGEISKEVGTGWRGRRKYASFLEAFFDGMNVEGDCHPTVRLLIASAALAGLQVVKSRRDKLYVGGSGLMGRAESEVVNKWEVLLKERVGEGLAKGKKKTAEWTGSTGGRDEETLLAWLAAEVLQSVPIETLAESSIHMLLSYLTTVFANLFSNGQFISSLSSDLSTTGDNLIQWNVPSPSFSTLETLSNSPVFVHLGAFSRALGQCIAAAGKSGTPESIAALRNHSNTCERIAYRVQRDWEATTWSDADDDDLEEGTRQQKKPWEVFKSLLFALTRFQSFMLELLEPKPGAKPTELQLQLAEQAVRVMGLTYFITAKIGRHRFEPWVGVWTGMLEVIKGDERAAGSLMRSLEPIEIGDVHEREVQRSRATFYLDVAEQVMRSLENQYIEDVILKCCFPYFENHRYQDSFESAHSVLLAIFAHGKPCALQIAPWYTRLLLKSYPDLMSASQLRSAFTAMIRCVSNSDDALAWYCILQLATAIQNVPLSKSFTTPASDSSRSGDKDQQISITPIKEDATTSRSDKERVDQAVNPAIPREFDNEASITRLEEASMLSPLETQALQLQRGHYLLTLIDQTTSVNLILLRSLLDKIWDFVKEEGNEESSSEIGSSKDKVSGKKALVKVVFNTLGEGLDATKREEGVRYWMEKGQQLNDA